MARGTYISENTTQTQINFMLMLDDYELDIFTLEDLKKTASHKFVNINEIVENLVHKKQLSRIERGKYCRYNFRDENVIGCKLVEDGAIAYWSALNKHGLTEQFPNSIFIQTTKSKADKAVFGVNYKFIRTATSKRAGLEKMGHGNHSYFMTDIEKTMIDCFDLPQYSGGYAELISAFNQAQLNGKKMIAYCKTMNNKAIIKRMGYLAEILNKKGMKSFINFALKEVNVKYNLFDSAGIEEGEFINKWRLRLNISKAEILDICNKQY
ncbi:MAG: hypothetical protein Q8J84_06290 [Flavobacteriaceae bacterium]|nr:hypothetical protein [Flavobacteriaceae bacterium]